MNLINLIQILVAQEIWNSLDSVHNEHAKQLHQVDDRNLKVRQSFLVRSIFLEKKIKQIIRVVYRGVYFSVWPPPPGGGGGNMTKYHVGEKKDWKGMKKEGKIHIFSPFGKKYAYFFLNWLKIYKNAKKGWKFFDCGVHLPQCNTFNLGKYYESGRAGCIKFRISPPPLLGVGEGHNFKTNWEAFQKGRKEGKKKRENRRKDRKKDKRKKKEVRWAKKIILPLRFWEAFSNQAWEGFQNRLYNIHPCNKF